ncbi:ASCH domain-containing protein [Kitasatospora sp. NPDC005856]|uniref:ASCH domain-containing protein n=1 Tax=Kitasatospora sp. NPDC005856 TaxID=3154566 RepID=UPI00340B923A
MSNRQPATHDFAAKRPRDMPIHRQYFDLIASGEKTVEVRVAYESMKRVKVGDLINFTCRESSCLTRVTRIGTYRTFEEMFGTRPPTRPVGHRAASGRRQYDRGAGPVARTGTAIVFGAGSESVG